MFEMPYAGEIHGDAVLIAGIDGILVTLRSTWLNDGRDARSGGLVDVVADERRYVYRLVGTADVEVRGCDPTGKSIIEGFFGPSVENVLASYDRVVTTRAPFLDPTHFWASTGRYVTEETLFLPLSDDGESVNKVLVFSQSRGMNP